MSQKLGTPKCTRCELFPGRDDDLVTVSIRDARTIRAYSGGHLLELLVEDVPRALAPAPDSAPRRLRVLA